MARIFVGVAWPYANGPFHLGHLAGAYLPADAFARFHRLRGNEVLMVSGSDMHGTPILVKAEAEGATPEVIARRYHEVNRESFRRLGFTFDLFTDTHTVVHGRVVQEVFLTLLEHGFIGRKTEENAYCPNHKRFLPDRYLVGTCPHCGFDKARGDECDNCGRVVEPRTLGSPRCGLCGTPAEFRPSEHFYLLLDKLAPQLERFLADKRYWRANVTNSTATFLKGGLRPTPITRDLEWGVPIPLEGYDSKRFYVWFDAVIGYLSASKEWAVRAGRPDAWQKYWNPRENARHYYFIGKDNMFHHTLIWPGILLGHGELALPYDVDANEWLTIEGGKIAKSRTGATDVFLPTLLDHYAPDVIRFYAAALAPQNHDTDFHWEEFHQVTEDVLSNQYGNLVQRLLVLTRDRYNGTIPSPPEGWSAEASGGVGDAIRAAHTAITTEFEAVRLKEALELALREVRDANRRFHEAHPWQATEEDRRRVLYETLWRVKAAATWLAPFLPFSSAEVFRMLGYPEPPAAGGWDQVHEPPPPGQSLGEVRPLFPKSDLAGTPAPDPAAATPQRTGSSSLPPLVIQAATVLEAQNHPSADRLYVLKLDVAEATPRTVVAGIRPYYRPEELAGRRVAVLANLEPRTIRMVTSQGMILAAESDGRVTLLEPPDSVSAGRVAEGLADAPRPVKHEEFERAPLVVGRVAGLPGSGGTRIDLGGRFVEADGVWPVGALVVVRLAAPEGTSGTVVAFGPDLPLRPSAEVPAGTKVR